MITERIEPAREVLKKIKPPAQRLARPVALEPLAAQLRARKGRVASLLYAFRRNIVRPRHGQADWHERVRRVERRLADQDQVLEEARQLLRAQATRDKNDKLFDRAEWGVRILRANDRSSEEQAREALRIAAGEKFNEWHVPEQLLRGAVVLWSDDLARTLKTAAEEFGLVIKAYQLIAQAKLAAAGELGSLVAKLPLASRYEMYHFIEDNARKSAIRMGTVGLAFSGGGIRSATFNLGFLQGAAALGLLTRFDYLSTVSGGGYIGAWFAAWVRREGGSEPQPPTDDDIDRELAALGAEAGMNIGGEATRPPPPVGAEQLTGAALEHKEQQTKARARERYDNEVAVQRQRTARALENVQMQLNSSRARQAEADRRWVSAQENGDGPEATHPAPCLKLTVEEEPEPVHHLREHSNYLAPRVGLSSIDTWTMVSVYLRNLFLNQFILLPMLLAVIALPRLLLLLFTHSTSDKMIPLARGWLDRHHVWPEWAVLGLAIVATFLVPKLMEFFAARIVRRLHRRTVQLATVSLLVPCMPAAGDAACHAASCPSSLSRKSGRWSRRLSSGPRGIPGGPGSWLGCFFSWPRCFVI